MSMNAISSRLKQNSMHSDEQTHSFSQLEGLNSGLININEISDEELALLRHEPRSAIDLDAMKKKYEDLQGLGRRVAPRYELNLSAIAINHRHSFRTSSINISASGALLQDKLPESFMSSSFEIIFLKEFPEEACSPRLLFSAMAIGGPLRTPRIGFRSSSLNSSENLLKLFEGLTPLAA